MKYRLAYMITGIVIMAFDLVLSSIYYNFISYSYLGSFFFTMIPFGIGFVMFMYGTSNGRFPLRRKRVKTKIEYVAAFPAVKSPDGNAPEFINLFTDEPMASDEYSRLLNEAARKYVSGELDDEGFYKYVRQHTWREEGILEALKKLRK